LAKVIININIRGGQCRGQDPAALWEGTTNTDILS